MSLEDRDPKCSVVPNTLQPNLAPSNKQPLPRWANHSPGDVPIIISQIIKEGSEFLLPMSPVREITLRRNVVLPVVADLCDNSGTGSHATGWYNACIIQKKVEERSLAVTCTSEDCDSSGWCSYSVSYMSRETPIATLRYQTSSLIFPSSSCST